MKRPFLTLFSALVLASALVPTTYAAVDLDNPSVKLSPDQIPSAVERLIREKKFDTALEYINEGVVHQAFSALFKFQKGGV